MCEHVRAFVRACGLATMVWVGVSLTRMLLMESCTKTLQHVYQHPSNSTVT